MPSPDGRLDVLRPPTLYARLLHVRAHAHRLHPVRVEEVVAEIEFGEPERNLEFGECGGQPGCSEESDSKFGAMEPESVGEGEKRGLGSWLQEELFAADTERCRSDRSHDGVEDSSAFLSVLWNDFRK